MPRIETTYLSQKLSGKTHNGDYVDIFYVEKLDMTVALLADGIGGSAGDWKASKTTVTVFKEYFIRYINTHNTPKIIKKSIEYANKTLLNETGTFKGLKTTLVVLVLDIKNQRCFYTGIGDSRLYIIQENTVQQLTTDQVKVIVRRKTDGTPYEINGSIINDAGVTNAVGINNIVFEIHEKPILPNTTFILASDGFYTKIYQSERTFRSLSQSINLEKTVSTIFKQAQQIQEDDISVAVVRISQIEIIESLSSLLNTVPKTENLLTYQENVCRLLLQSISDKDTQVTDALLKYIKKYELKLGFDCFDKAIKQQFLSSFDHSEIYQQLIDLLRKSR